MPWYAWPLGIGSWLISYYLFSRWPMRRLLTVRVTTTDEGLNFKWGSEPYQLRDAHNNLHSTYASAIEARQAFDRLSDRPVWVERGRTERGRINVARARTIKAAKEAQLRANRSVGHITLDHWPN